ncbi:WD40 repeat - like 10 [Theobroma cacao]|nr:WD40 repeat - like 10 [Theobroma cacao]
MTTAATATTSSRILHHTTAFTSEILSQSELRHRILSTLRRKLLPSDQLTLKPLNLAAETLENAVSASNASIQSSSLRVAQKLLLSYPEATFSSFLLSLIYSLSNQPIKSSLSLLQVFYLDPSLARSELAPTLFEDLFLVHFLPVLQWFNEQRSTILSSLSPNVNHDADDYSICDVSVVVPCSKLLSKMSGDQALELKELERNYEEVLDENCRVLVKYFKEVLENSDDGNRLISPPALVLKQTEKDEELDYYQEDKNIKTKELGLKNGRYNPIWAEGERTWTTSSNLNSDSELESISEANSCSSEPEAEMEENNREIALLENGKSLTQKQKQPVFADSSCSLDYLMADNGNPPGSGKHTPPKDFVCPITSHIFDDPVTLETGQTYERRAIQEWLDRGNSTCPITRQNLQSTQLPKTNYVLKRLIGSWQEKNPGPVPHQSENHQDIESKPMVKSIVPATSPNSVISQATMDRTINELRQAITNLCMSEILKESERAVLQIERFWQDMNIEPDILTMLSKPPVINGFVEILFNSVDLQVLKATFFLLCELGSRDDAVIHTLTRVDSDVERIVALFKEGLEEAVVLIYLLQPSTTGLVAMDVVESLLAIIKKRDDDIPKMCMKPKTASVLLLRQILQSNEENVASSIISIIVSSKVIESIVSSLEAEWAVERIAAVGILRRCIQEDGKCRNIIADKAQLAPVLESFLGTSGEERFEIVYFFYELVKLHRRTFNEQVLNVIRDEGAFSTMHSLLVYLQTALQDQCPIVAGLLLQLDLLVEPRKMSIYREEAIDTLISCLRNSEFPAAQIAAAETIVSLQGRFTGSGKPLTRPFLLKRAGLEKNYRNLMRMEQLHNNPGKFEDISQEEKAADAWERKMAFVLVSHEFGLLFEALAEGLKSRSAELCSACFVAATWLVHMLSVIPDTGIRGAARVCLLKRFISIFKTAKDIEDRTLSLLALKSFIHDPEGLRDLASYMKDILKGLRELRKSSPLAFEIIKVLSEGQESSADMWNHKELVQVDSSENGEVLSMVSFKDKIFSGHSDGTIKVWTGRGSILHLVQEIREHSKPVTSLYILQSGERLYSGSLDKTARVWSIGDELIHCVQVHDMKDQVHNLVVANSISCFIPQGAGVKVHAWNGQSKLLNQNKYIKCLALVHGRLYCGCHDTSIQELDLASGTLSTIQSGSRKLLGKAHPVHALQVHNGLIYSASPPLDGVAVKIWSATNYSMVGSLPTTSEVRSMALSSELIYLGCRGGIVEVWDQKKHTRIEILQTGTNSKVLCMTLDANEEVLVIGTSDGRIQIEILKRLQRESFSDLMKLRDRQDKVERLLSLYRTSKGNPFQESSTHLRGEVDLLGAVLLMSNVDEEHWDGVGRAGIRTGVGSRFRFETTVRDKDSVGVEFVANQKRDTSTDGDEEKGLTDLSFGPPLLHQHNGGAIGMTLRKSNIIASLAQSVSGMRYEHCCSTFVQVVCQLPIGLKFSFLGLHRGPKLASRNVRLGAFAMPIGFSRHLEDADTIIEASSPPFTTNILETGSIALKLESELDEYKRLAGWIEMKQTNSKHLQWAVNLTDFSEDVFGWGMSLGGIVEVPGNWDKFQIESYIKFNLGKRFNLKPGVAYVVDGNSRTLALMLQSNWSL